MTMPQRSQQHNGGNTDRRQPVPIRPGLEISPPDVPVVTARASYFEPRTVEVGGCVLGIAKSPEELKVLIEEAKGYY